MKENKHLWITELNKPIGGTQTRMKLNKPAKEIQKHTNIRAQ